MQQTTETTQYQLLYQSAPQEHTTELIPSFGKIPETLNGVLYRNGPARWEINDIKMNHLFDGDGMVSRFAFNNGKLAFRNRYIRTGKFKAGNKGHAKRGLGTQRPGGMIGNFLQLYSDRANTHAVYHADRLLALSDDGRPWSINPDTLDTIGRTRFKGKLPHWSLFSPHPRIDSKTGEMFNFGIVPHVGSMAGLACYRIDQQGKFSHLATIPVNHLYINHDFAITENYLVFVLAPIVINPMHAAKTVLGLSTFDDASLYDENIATQIVLVPRNGGKIKKIECPPLIYVHFNNAYEDKDAIIIDLLRHHEWDAVNNAVKHFRDAPVPAGPLTRITVKNLKSVEVNDLSAMEGEFPQHDTRLTGQKHRYSYFPTSENYAITKLDHDTASATHHAFNENDMPGEPIFAAKGFKAKEDEGWIMSLVYRHADHKTDLVILNAEDLESDPVAVVPLPEAMFPGFHGSFVGM